MLRRYIVVLMMMVAANTYAQENSSNLVKITEKKDDTQIDYKQIGAPMPPIKIILYKDTGNKNTAANATMDNYVPQKERKKRKDRNNTGSKTYSGVITNADVDNGSNLFVMLFNPTCSHCEDETVLIEQNSTLFKKSKFLMMANPIMKPYLPDFVNMLHVTDYPVFSVGIDSAGYVDKVFLYQALPQINIYSADRKLLKVYTGEVSIDSLKKYIE